MIKFKIKEFLIINILFTGAFCFSESWSFEMNPRSAEDMNPSRSVGALTQSSDTVVLGTAIKKETFYTQGVRGAEVITLITFTDLEVLKGSHNKDHFVLQLPGGVLPSGLNFMTEGTPQFEIGDRALLFTKGGRFLTMLQHGSLKVNVDRYGYEYVDIRHGAYSEIDLSEITNEVRWSQ